MAVRHQAEIDWSEVPYPDTVQGQASTIPPDAGSGDHVFLYVPDISVQTGWSTHRVPERQNERVERRSIGFRR